ncbi:chromosome partitioning protein ParB [Brasilonema sp. CT11]|nr:chromosome partitioning protein ParB [Brasilonema sp. CT11]
MTTFLMVDVASVTSSVPRSNFIESDLDILANTILESGGILKPLVLKKIGFEKYEVIDGHFEYYAAVRAREKNPSEGETVNALIISPDKEEAVLKQAVILKRSDSGDKSSVETTPAIKNSELSRIANIELRLEKQINELRSELAQERHKLDDKLKHLEGQIPKQIQPLEAFNTLILSELTPRLISAGFTTQAAAKVAESVDKERKKKKFASLSDVVARVKVTNGNRQVKGITSEKMVEIIDSWSRLLFL